MAFIEIAGLRAGAADVMPFRVAGKGSDMEKSVAIVQTSGVSTADLHALCGEIMPGVKLFDIIDSSLLAEVVANGGVTTAVRRRLVTYYEMAQSIGVDAILNQCSSVGEVVDVARPLIDIPIVKVDEAMARKAVSMGRKIAVVATVESTMGPSSRLVETMAREASKEIELNKYLANGAMMVLIETGDREKHNEMLLGEIERAASENDVVVLAQGSMIVIEPLLSHIKTPVLTSPRLGAEYLKEVLYK